MQGTQHTAYNSLYKGFQIGIQRNFKEKRKAERKNRARQRQTMNKKQTNNNSHVFEETFMLCL